MLAGSGKQAYASFESLKIQIRLQFANTDNQMLCIHQKLEKQFHHEIPLQRYDWIP